MRAMLTGSAHLRCALPTRTSKSDAKRQMRKVQEVVVVHVRRRDANDGRLEIADQLDLLFRIGTGHRHDHAAESLRTEKGTEAASEQAVAKSVVQRVAAPTARRTDLTDRDVDLMVCRCLRRPDACH